MMCGHCSAVSSSFFSGKIFSCLQINSDSYLESPRNYSISLALRVPVSWHKKQGLKRKAVPKACHTKHVHTVDFITGHSQRLNVKTEAWPSLNKTGFLVWEWEPKEAFKIIILGAATHQNAPKQFQVHNCDWSHERKWKRMINLMVICLMGPFGRMREKKKKGFRLYDRLLAMKRRKIFPSNDTSSVSTSIPDLLLLQFCCIWCSGR